jgi:hypothetical protein
MIDNGQFKELLYVLGAQDYSDGGLAPALDGVGKDPLISSLKKGALLPGTVMVAN